MKKLVLTTLIFLLSWPVFAQSVSFYVLSPEKEGDPDSAKPYLAEFFDYLKEETGIAITGMYINTTTNADLDFKQGPVHFAIIPNDYFEQNEKKFNFTKRLMTMPIYSGGPFERYYIMANLHADILTLMEQQTPVRLVATKYYSDIFLSEKIFGDSGDIKKVLWKFEQTPDILEAIKQIAGGDPGVFVFLTGYEFSIVNGLRKQNRDFAKLKLVYTSPELPSSSLVTVGVVDETTTTKIQEALLNMSGNLRGDMILKKLRLKGFAGL